MELERERERGREVTEEEGKRERGREGGREGEREREGGREGGRKGEREEGITIITDYYTYTSLSTSFRPMGVHGHQKIQLLRIGSKNRASRC